MPATMLRIAKTRGHEGETALLAAHGLHKSYHKGSIEIPVLRGVEFEVYPGEFVSIIGQSGSGKSTLLHLLATLDEPDKGEIFFDGERIDDQPSATRDELRNKQLGMIFQFYHLLPELSTLDNVLLPTMIAESVITYWWNRAAHVKKATELLEMVGLGHRLHHLPRELSGGEMQRAAIARALIAGPRILLADEPTGNLDSGNGREVLRVLQELNRDHGLTLVMVTHDESLANTADRVVRLREGRVEQA